ncbi:hypothetical protein C0995_012924 [Termitomyces sp. Mi166|nr:hypothetical protein C0995_012924 [Termitomyces sp. Mi166\
MPTKTSKLKEGKQGIKELSSKDGCLLLNALQIGNLKLIKSNMEKIKKDEITVIVTAEPTTRDAPTPAPKSAAATHIKQKKAAFIGIYSNNESKSKIHPAINVKSPASVTKKQQPSKLVYTISSDSDLSPALTAKQPLPKKHTVTVYTDSDLDDSFIAEKDWSLPSPSAKQQSTKKCAAIIVSNNENDKALSDDKKQHRLTPPDANETIGSDDNYINEEDNKFESGTALTF